MTTLRSPARVLGAIAFVLALAVAACAPAEDGTDTAESPGDTDTGDTDAGGTEPDDATEEPAGGDETEQEDTGGTEPPAEQREVLLAIPAPSLNFLPYMFAMDRGLDVYEQEGIDLSVDIIRGDVALAGVLEGSVHFTAAGGTAMRAALGGAPVRAVMFTVGQTTFSVMGKDDIDGVAGLADRTVGIVGAGLSDTTGVALQAALRSEGLDAEQDLDVFVAPTPPDILSALIGGSIDAAVLAPPQSYIAEAEGFVEIAQLWDYADLTQGQIATSTELLEEDPELVKAFVTASLAAIEYVVDNPEEALDYIVERFELAEPVAQRSYEVMQQAYAREGRPSDEAIVGGLGEDATSEDIPRVVDWGPLDEVMAERS